MDDASPWEARGRFLGAWKPLAPLRKNLLAKKKDEREGQCQWRERERAREKMHKVGCVPMIGIW